jgi:hypothetical protein
VSILLLPCGIQIQATLWPTKPGSGGAHFQLSGRKVLASCLVISDITLLACFNTFHKVGSPGCPLACAGEDAFLPMVFGWNTMGTDQRFLCW